MMRESSCGCIAIRRSECMRNVTLFIAMSLDGYIADGNGNVDWLQGQVNGQDDMESYTTFIKDVDTVVMGWNTYHQVRFDLSPDIWMYEDLKSYVITHRQLGDEKNIFFKHQDVGEVVKELREEEGKGIWICGGAGIIQPLIQQHLIDVYHISIIPTILGKGIRLFEQFDKEIPLQLLETRNYNGIVDVIYKEREK